MHCCYKQSRPLFLKKKKKIEKRGTKKSVSILKDQSTAALKRSFEGG